MKNKKHLTIILLSLFIISCSKNELEVTQQNEKIKIKDKYSMSSQPPSMGTVIQTVKRIIKENLGVEEHNVALTINLVNDLGADELNIAEIVVDIENEFDIDFYDEDIEKLHTVEDYVIFTYSRLSTVTIYPGGGGGTGGGGSGAGGGGAGGGTGGGGTGGGGTGGGGTGGNGSISNSEYESIMNQTSSIESSSPNVVTRDKAHNVPEERKKAYEWEIAYNPFVYWKVISHETGTHKKVNNEWHWKTLQHNNFSVIDNHLSVISITVTENGQAISTLGLYYAGIEVGCNVKATIAHESIPIGASPKNYRKNSPLFFSNTP